MIQILIADDSNMIQECLTSILDSHPDFKVVGTAHDGLEALKKAGDLHPDVVIMDAQMPNLDGVEATRRIKQAFPDVGVLFLSVFTDCMEAGIGAGADGYLEKDCNTEELFSEVRSIAAKYGRKDD